MRSIKNGFELNRPWLKWQTNSLQQTPSWSCLPIHYLFANSNSIYRKLEKSREPLCRANGRNIVGSCCVRLLVAKLSLTGFNLCAKTPNNTQRRKRTKNLTSNTFGSCWPKILRPFARPGLRTMIFQIFVQKYLLLHSCNSAIPMIFIHRKFSFLRDLNLIQ